MYLLCHESFIYIIDKFTKKRKDGATCHLNVTVMYLAITFFFEEISYKLSGVEVDGIKNVGTTSTMKNL